MNTLPLGLGAFAYLRSGTNRTGMLPRIVAALGAGANPVYAREDFQWSVIQPTAGGAFVWATYDSLVSDCANAGITVWPICDKPPTWAVGGNSTSDSWTCAPLSSLATQGGASNAQADFATFCGAVAARYGPEGSFWAANPSVPYYPCVNIEVWNEPYQPGSWKSWNGSISVTINSTGTDYAAIFSAAASAIHATAGAKAFAAVATGTSNNGATVPAAYLIPFLAAVTVNPDGLSLHPYPNDYYPASVVWGGVRNAYAVEWQHSWNQMGQVNDARDILNNSGLSGLPIWLTELGWPTQLSGTSVVLGTTQAQAEAQQAMRIHDLFAWARRNVGLIQGLFIYCFNNPYAPDQSGQSNYSATNPECFFGLWHTDGTGGALDGATCTAKPAVAALTAEAATGVHLALQPTT